MSDTEALVRFYRDWHTDGEQTEDGLPLYREVIMITLARPPLLRIDRVAEDSDFDEFPAALDMFQREERTRTITEKEGYPLAMWPACNLAQVKMLAGKDIYTVEQLAKLAAKRGDQSIPGEIRDLAVRAQAMIAMQKSGAKYEARVHDLEAQVEMLNEERNEARATINALTQTIDNLRAKVA